MNNILIIQNTLYHFEVTIYLYSTLKKLGYNPFIYRCEKIEKEDRTNEQIVFLKKYNLNTVHFSENIETDNFSCAFLVSAYPNPFVSKDNCIPNSEDKIFKIFNQKIIYVVHRFANPSDYSDSYINKYNCVSLSPISSNINIDYINLIDSPFNNTNDLSNLDIIKNLDITIQGHFEFNNRNINYLNRLINSIKNRKITLNILGTKTSLIYNTIDKNNTNLEIKIFDSLNNINFYNILNNTNMILGLIDPNFKNKDYSILRYSTNFCHAICLEKPIICDKFFYDIYKIPGIYYDVDSATDIDISLISNEQYKNMIDAFSGLKKELSNHNDSIIRKKIDFLNAVS